jgi:hypothetical protein
MKLMGAILLAITSASAQERAGLDVQQNEERSIEAIVQEQEDSQLLEVLAEIRENPMDLNRASLEEMTRLPWINSLMASELIAYRRRKPFLTVEQLGEVESFSTETVKRSRFYFFVQPSRFDTAWKIHGSGRSRYRSDLQPRKGFVDGTFGGSSIGMLNRVLVTAEQSEGIVSRADFAFMNEKDPGELVSNGYSSFYLALANEDRGIRMVLGDYVVEVGEGLVLWRSFAPSKGPESFAAVRRNGSGLRPSVSTDETWVLHGCAAEWKTRLASLLVFVSSRRLNANIDSTALPKSIYSDGLFRTAGEVGKMNVLDEQLSGFRLAATPLEGVRAGLSLYSSQLYSPIAFGGGSPSNHVSLIGIDLAYTTRAVDAFAEVARDRLYRLSWIAGAIVAPSKLMSAGVVARSYAEGFENPRGNAFGERFGPPENEQGIYTTLRVAPFDGLKLSIYSDQFQSISSTGTILERVRGHDFLFDTQLSISHQLYVDLLFKEKNKPISMSTLDPLGRSVLQSSLRNQQNLRLTVENTPSERLQLKTRTEFVSVSNSLNGAIETGFLAYQELRYTPRQSYSVAARLIVFETASFDSRLYEFETDFRSSFANPALFGHGLRWFVLVNYRFATSTQVSAKYSYTYRDGARTIGAGANEISGAVESGLGLQIDVSF